MSEDQAGKSKSTLHNQIALQLNDAEDILDVIQSQTPKARPPAGEDFVAPRTPVEKTLAEIWSHALSVEQVGVSHNFFHLGGTSLMATQLLSDVYDAFQVELTLKELFDDAPTIAGLAQAIERRQIEQADIAATFEELEKMSEASAGQPGGEARLKQD